MAHGFVQVFIFGKDCRFAFHIGGSSSAMRLNLNSSHIPDIQTATQVGCNLICGWGVNICFLMLRVLRVLPSVKQLHKNLDAALRNDVRHTQTHTRDELQARCITQAGELKAPAASLPTPPFFLYSPPSILFDRSPTGSSAADIRSTDKFFLSQNAGVHSQLQGRS